MVILLLLIPGCVGSGCVGGNSDNKERVRQEVSRAFSNEVCPYLFMSQSSGGLGVILRGSLPKGFLQGVEHTSDGRTLRIWNRQRTQYYILDMGEEPRIISTPPGAFLNHDNEVILTCTHLGKAEVTFPDGSQIDFTSFIVDADGQYLCVGGVYWDDDAEVRREAPVTIRAVGAPETVLTTSRMRGIVEKAVCFPDKLYVFVREYPGGNGAGWANYESYDRQAGGLVLTDSGRITTPLSRSDFVLVEDVCPQQRHFLLFANRHAPLSSHCYLLDVKSKDRDDLGATGTQYYTGFLDREVFREVFRGHID